MTNRDNEFRGNEAQPDRKQSPGQEVQDQLTGKRPGVPGGPGSWQSDSPAEARNKAAIAAQRQRRGRGDSKL